MCPWNGSDRAENGPPSPTSYGSRNEAVGREVHIVKNVELVAIHDNLVGL